MRTHIEPAYSVTIWIAGDVEDARRGCRSFTFDEGLCVTITPTEFVYTGGLERGVAVGLVNYPRFPSHPAAIYETATRLAEYLMDRMFQTSALVDTPDQTLWIERRDDE